MVWDDTQKIPYAMFNVASYNQYIFAENARSFAEKLRLINQYHLLGFSVWRLGAQDPRIWNEIKA